MNPSSLRRQLSFWLLLPLLGLLALDAWLTYTRAMTAANAAFDRTLEASLKAMREGVRLRNKQFAIDLPYLAPVSYTHLTLPTKEDECRSRWSPYH